MPLRVPRLGNPAWVVARQTARRAARSGALWGLIFGIYVAASALGYAAAYPTAAARAKLAASFGSNAGLAALLGPARRLDTVAGFTGWRTTAVLGVAGAVWGLLLATRMLRGEEDAGRWELYLSGQTTRRGAAAEAVAGLGAGLAALWAVTAVVTVAAGSSPKVRFSTGGSLYLATCLVAGAAIFLALGAVLSELGASRRQANGIGTALLAAMYLLRMVVDSTSGLAWLRWATPLGWIEELHPFVGPRPLALVPIAALVTVATSAAIVIAGNRDLGASAFPSRDRPRPHTALLGSPLGLTIRQIRPVFAGWAAGFVVSGLVLGLVANSAAASVANSSGFQKAIGRLGAHGSGVKAILGVTFIEVAAVAALAAAGQVTATRTEESSGRLDHLLVRPVSRYQWLGGRLGVAAALVVAITVLGGLASWLGTATQGGGVGIGELALAGVNMAPPALFVLGIGALAYGLVPRVAPIVPYALVGWSFLVELVASLVTTNRLLLDTSVLAHISPAPAAKPNWASAGLLVLLGLLAAGAGLVCLRRRDLAGE